jgi:FkbM family methyltransferase
MKDYFLNFCIKESSYSYIIKYIKIKIFRFLTVNSLDIFVRGNDIISTDPQVLGVHEPIITKLIDNFCDKGYSDFLLDIGANIGLTSCQNGTRFKIIYMFEPNPLCSKILEVNSKISLGDKKYTIFNFGLGNINKKSILTIPKKNWAGAFIKDNTNSYDEKIFAKKDQFDKYIKSNYFKLEIKIRNTEQQLKNIFKDFLFKNFNKGVIKIDVEGYELAVIEGIAKVIPKNISAFIIFESWNKNLNINNILELFNGRAKVYKIVKKYPWEKRWPKIIKIFSMLLNRKFINKVTINEDNDWSGDLILKIN